MTGDVGSDFLITELKTGMMFAGIARRSSRDPRKVDRNRRNARKAYDTVLKFMGTVQLTGSEDVLIRERLQQLKKVLVDLGEPIA